MTFRVAPLLWLLLGAPPLLLLLVVRERRRARIARQFISERLRGVANSLRATRPWLIAAGLAACVVAAAGPYAGFTLVPITAREANRVLVIDVSNSMAAEDFGTSRLSAAKALAKQLVDAHSGRIGLVVFESSAEVVSPLTNDGEAVLALVDSLQPGEVGNAGSDIGTAVIAALRLLERDPSHAADIVVISDGEDQGRRIEEATARAKTRGASISTIMIGLEAGASIPSRRGVLRDSSGKIVTTYARPAVLAGLARDTGGRFYENPFSEGALGPLLALQKGSERETHVRVPIDRYQWPLSIGLALLLLGSLVNRGAE
jgi:Ca-activated chloride channel family protein